MSEENNNSMSELEQQLRKLQPHIALTESDLMYRCGWDAAIAASDSPQSRPPSWKGFLSGVACGLAASLPLVFGNVSFPMNQRETHQDVVSVPVDAVTLTENVSVASVVNEPSESSIIDMLAPSFWRDDLSEQTRFSLSNSNEGAALSLVAKRHWSDELTNVSYSPSRSPEAQPFVDRRSLEAQLLQP